MAELLLTPEEKNKLPFLKWDDISLGKAVKAAAIILSDDEGRQGAKLISCAVVLIVEMLKSNTADMTIDLTDIVHHGEALGSFHVKIVRTDSETQEP